MRNRSLARAGAISIFALAGCGSGSTVVPAGGLAGTPATTVQSRTEVRFTITFPARLTASTARQPLYVSPSIASLTVAIDGAAPLVVDAPSATGAPRTITTSVPIAPGAHAFVVGEYDKAGGAGNLLGQVSQTNTILAGQLNTLVFTVNGQLARIEIQPPASGFVQGSLAAGFTLVGPGPQTFTAIPQDADGNTIVDPGAIPQLTVTSASPTGVTPRMGSGNTFTLQAPVPTQDRAYVAITVSGTDLGGKIVNAPVFGVNSAGAFYVADYAAQKIRAFDEFGTPLKLPATAFAGITNPEGLAYVPGNPGAIVVTQTANASAPYVIGFDPSGNPQSFGANPAFAGLSRPLFLTFGQIGSSGRFFVPDFFKNSLSEYDPTGAALAPPAATFRTGLNPVAAAYDPNDNQLYVTNDGSDTVARYAIDGTFLSSAPVGSHPMGIAYDSNNKSLYMTYGGTGGAATDGKQPQVPGIVQLSEAPAVVSNSGGFTNSSTTAYFTGVAVDPYLKQVYVADAGDSAILAFSESGMAVTLPAGAFGTISPTMAPASNPMAILFAP